MMDNALDRDRNGLKIDSRSESRMRLPHLRLSGRIGRRVSTLTVHCGASRNA